ncbi:type II toxin-antitoxin system prevent-host-death family antitoxin [Agromyces protaetiae]|uniref:Antitoxin n=1 Tax=Agromyces protaetiae TaxID=2509455 RepID=A0A4P6FC74_9MICO|nr:type II toxin-antitoxin system prevent-host-death family antitoxin [Agromyces protaetiae]QAY73632.1 type II toxin-antitoxin system prevent-host-death family antitoxin [Agromyces protaetiae]
MSTISHREMRNNSAEVLRRVESGETITVTNRGRAVAQLIPMPDSVLDELEARGQLRRATKPLSSLRGLHPVQLDESTEEILADLRGDR